MIMAAPSPTPPASFPVAPPAVVPVDTRTVPNETMFYTKLPDNRIQCGVCRQACMIENGCMGICGTRVNHNGSLFTLCYGEASSVAVGPIEMKPFFHFLPGCNVLSVGSVGCNFRCKFCQNWEISQKIEEVRATEGPKAKWRCVSAVQNEIEEICGQRISPQRLVEVAKLKGCSAIAFTYNEPTIMFEYSYDTMRLARPLGIRTVYVTNGYMSEKSARFIAPWIDAVNIDLKSFNSDFYKDVCEGSLEGVCTTIKLLHELGVNVEVTTLVIEGVNDSDEEILKVARFLESVSPDIPWHLAAAHPDFQMRNIPATSCQTLRRVANIARQANLRYVYIGNVPSCVCPDLVDTHCPKCNAMLIQRHKVPKPALVDLDTHASQCKNCHTHIPGVWH